MIARLAVAAAACGFLCGCGNASDRAPIPGSSQDGAKDAIVKPMDQPFIEHPSGEFDTAVEAMADAIKSLRALPKWDRWITFHAQGMGDREDSYHFAEIRMRAGEIAFEQPTELDIPLVTKRAAVPESCLSRTQAGYSIARATPIQAARILDEIFRQYLGIRPHPGEGNDYAIGAEW
jgi:hypothetical protein